MEEKIRETGRKASILLEEEKKKRKEIIRIDDNPKVSLLPGLSSRNKTAKSSFSESVRSTLQKNSRKTTTKTKPPANHVKRQKRKHSSKKANEDVWTPKLDGLSCYQLPHEEKSNVIRLHGLPLGVKFDHIRKFFADLSPERIFVLPSLNTYINDFDESEEDPSSSGMSTRDPFIKRYPNHFRVYVKFKSHPIAAVALGRAGETIRVENNCNDSQTLWASVGITPVSKTIASHLLKYMAIDGIKGSILEETISEVENNIPHVVNQILWVMARRKLKLNVEISRIGGGKFDIIAVENLDVALVPSNITEYQKMSLLYNQLWDMHEKLEYECMPTQMHEFDLSVVNLEPGQHYVSVAAHWLIDEMVMINQCLAYYRCSSRNG